MPEPAPIPICRLPSAPPERRLLVRDPLTSLPSVVTFRQRLDESLARARRSGEALAVVALGLDRFANLNDFCGHEAGDRVLLEVADRLRAHLGPDPALARTWGDEFAFVLGDCADAEAAAVRAARMCAVILEPMLVGHRSVVVGSSAGVAFAADATRTAAELLDDAEAALHRAKDLGGGRACLFEAGLRAQAADRVDVETDLRAALAGNELCVHFQPVVHLATGAVIASEALVRWRHPTRGFLPPDAFLPIAERSGLMLPLGRSVLERALRQQAAWRRTGIGGATVAVNVSPSQLADDDLPRTVAGLLARSGLRPDELCLEVTEDALAGNPAAAAAAMAELRALGVRLAIDDFGIGHANLERLARFPFDVLKIDRAFVAGASAGVPRELLHSIVAMAHALRLTVVAEGVETAAQAAALQAMGCEAAQGYWWSPPLAPDAMAVWSAARSLAGGRTQRGEVLP